MRAAFLVYAAYAAYAACAACAAACGPARKGGAKAGDAALHDPQVAAEPPRGDALLAIEHAEDGRVLASIEEAWLLSEDVVVRRRAMRAVARIADSNGDAAAEAPLLRGLGDEDREVVAWAAYGLGWSCKGKEDARVRALAARQASLAPEAPPDGGVAPRNQLDPTASITRAIGRCGGALAEGVLVGALRPGTSDAMAEEAAYALGSVAGRRALSDEAIGALVDRAVGDSNAAAAAMFAIGRLDRVPPTWGPRVLQAGRSILFGASPLRAFAVRALEKVGLGGAPDLARAAASKDLTSAERAEAARALGRLATSGPEARDAAGAALARSVDAAALTEHALGGDGYNVLLSLVTALGAEAPKTGEAALRTLAALPLPPKDDARRMTRVVGLRCAAAGPLARGAYDSEVLAKCDPDPTGAMGETARLAALLRRPLTFERRKAFRALAASKHAKVREAAVEAVLLHPELEDVGRAILVQALGAEEPGVVAAAAEAMVQHPERVLTLSAKERRAALDPHAPPPTTHPEMDLPADVATALTHALAKPWREDAVETRTALLDAAVAVSLPATKPAAQHACADPNITVREHAQRALRSLGKDAPSCPMPPLDHAEHAEHAEHASKSPPPLTHPVRVKLEVSGAKLAVVFEPDLTPMAAARFVALARSGFYKGIVVHRVVPGYVVQFGDPGADGYGGSGELLRCETSPVPFGLLDVGVALSGRDTGSSQIFVSLGRYPKLDGDYARVGYAEGDWGAVAEGDVVESVTVEE